MKQRYKRLQRKINAPDPVNSIKVENGTLKQSITLAFLLCGYFL